MSSPFPGMDPYLEGSLWTTLHFALAGEMVRWLAPRLRPRYLVLPVERFIMETPEGVAIPTPVPHVSIEIRDRAHRQLVTAIELLSPTNKRGEGRDEYLAKRRRILLSTAHLLEIGLLRQGARVPVQHPLPSAPYFVFLSRVEQRPLMDVWPIYLDQSLPTIPVPLLPDDADLPLDLQQCFNATYELLGYSLAIDYTQALDVPLPDELAAWADARLRQAGLRGSDRR